MCDIFYGVTQSTNAYKWEFARDIYGTKKVQAVLSLIISYLVSALYYQRQWIQINEQLVTKKMMGMGRGRMEFHLCVAIQGRHELLDIYNFEGGKSHSSK